MGIFRKMYWIFGLEGTLGFALGTALVMHTISFGQMCAGGAGIICSALSWIVIAE
jgi:hypothetical protein